MFGVEMLHKGVKCRGCAEYFIIADEVQGLQRRVGYYAAKPFVQVRGIFTSINVCVLHSKVT